MQRCVVVPRLNYSKPSGGHGSKQTYTQKQVQKKFLRMCRRKKCTARVALLIYNYFRPKISYAWGTGSAAGNDVFCTDLNSRKANPQKQKPKKAMTIKHMAQLEFSTMLREEVKMEINSWVSYDWGLVDAVKRKDKGLQSAQENISTGYFNATCRLSCQHFSSTMLWVPFRHSRGPGPQYVQNLGLRLRKSALQCVFLSCLDQKLI